MSGPRLLQKRFAQALIDRDRAPPEELAGMPRRFAVHRNNVHVSLADALAARFPACCRLVGEAFFRAMAGVFIELCPPRSPLLMRYGDELPIFLELFPPARPVPYLADVARLEIARSEAYNSAEAEPLDPSALAAVPAEAWAHGRLRLHPSTRVVKSAHPIVSIWPGHAMPAAPMKPRPEDALIARPGVEVEVRALPPGAAAFIEGLAVGKTIPEAAAATPAETSAATLAAWLNLLVEARLMVSIEYLGAPKERSEINEVENP